MNIPAPQLASTGSPGANSAAPNAAKASVNAVTKFGVVALSEHLCMELEGTGAKTKVSVLCPGFVATKIMDSERNRPADRQDASSMPTDPQSEIFYEWFRGEVEKGLDPRTVGDQVLSAIREERFYILTHPVGTT